MSFTYSLIENIIVAEFLLVILIIILAYVLKSFYFARSKNNQSIKAEIIQYITDLLNQNKDSFDPSQFLAKWQKLDILLQIIREFDHSPNKDSNATIKNCCEPLHPEASEDQKRLSSIPIDTKASLPQDSWDRWQNIKNQLLQTILLNIARKYVKSRKWVNRLLAAECFQLHMEAQDERLITTLLKDPLPIIHLYAALAAIKFGSETLITQVISVISQKRRFAQTVYLQGFKTTPPDTQVFVQQCLQRESNPFARATCYKILLQYPTVHDFKVPENDIYSSNVELAVAATRFFAHIHQKEATAILVNLLTSSYWELRTVAASLLGQLKTDDVSTLSSIANCLYDPVWYVRINAATALKNIGAKGMEILEGQTPEKDHFAYDAAMHVLHKRAGSVVNSRIDDTNH